MKSDLFIGAGAGFLIWAVYLLFTGLRSRQSQRALTGVLWGMFGIGLLLQGFAPPLEITRNAFSLSPSLQPEADRVGVPALVARARWMQTTSAVLTNLALVGLALSYCLTSLWKPSVPQGVTSDTGR